MTHNKKSTRYYSTKQEKQVAKTVNGKCQSNSGATLFCKRRYKDRKMAYGM